MSWTEGNEPEFPLIPHKILTRRFYCCNGSILPVRQISIRISQLIILWKQKHQNEPLLPLFFCKNKRKWHVRRAPTWNKKGKHGLIFVVYTFFFFPVTGRQMNWRRAELDWCVPSSWQFWIMALATHTTSSSGMSDKMILIPHINEINESVRLKVEEPGFFPFLSGPEIITQKVIIVHPSICCRTV